MLVGDMKVWAIANQKGGVGKTTTAISVAGHLVTSGYRTLLVDIDPHGSLTSYLGHDPEGETANAFTLFTGDESAIHNTIRHTEIERLSIIPSSTALATLDRRLGAQPGMGLILKHHLGAVAEQYDYVIVDCPPMLGVLMINALAACDLLLVPVQAEYLALKGLERMVRTINMINHSRQHELPYIIVPTMYDKRTRVSPQALSRMHQSYGSKLWNSFIPVDTKFREASLRGLPINFITQKSRGVEAYSNLISYLLNTQLQNIVEIKAVSNL